MIYISGSHSTLHCPEARGEAISAPLKDLCKMEKSRREKKKPSSLPQQSTLNSFSVSGINIFNYCNPNIRFHHLLEHVIHAGCKCLPGEGSGQLITSFEKVWKKLPSNNQGFLIFYNMTSRYVDIKAKKKMLLTASAVLAFCSPQSDSSVV